MCFVDLLKAFDRVPRGILSGVLLEYRVPGPLIRALPVPRTHHFLKPEMVLTQKECSEEAPNETLLLEATQEVQTSTGAAGHVLHCHNSVCPISVHLSVVWLIHKIGQVQTATNNQVCRENHQG
ncbi:hypothetical protein AMECASPLE_010335 [Ameca splendens]|uniref:Reverse transcriptase domain-containing protein n=1 Tax=Ameca splendens TaxID=208324 RepID=A0ABV0ZAA1_9TELE